MMPKISSFHTLEELQHRERRDPRSRPSVDDRPHRAEESRAVVARGLEHSSGIARKVMVRKKVAKGNPVAT